MGATTTGTSALASSAARWQIVVQASVSVTSGRCGPCCSIAAVGTGKGLPERAVVLKHAFRGAIVPVASFLGPAAAGILTGSFVIETLFAVPGMGQYFVRGAMNRDYSVVLGTALLYCTLVTLFNLVVDSAYAWLDPRVRNEA